jgi:SAM-dependent methyltransferase
MTDRTTDVALQVHGLFDAKVAAWPSKYAPGSRLVSRLTRLTDAVAYHVPVGGSVLDLGCGTGELAITLATSGLRETGCDISPEMLQRAAAAHSSGTVDWVRLDPGWQVLSFDPETFDAVVGSSVLEYVDDAKAVLRECRRVLPPGGILLCTLPDPRHPVRWLEWLIDLVAREPTLLPAGSHWPGWTHTWPTRGSRGSATSPAGGTLPHPGSGCPCIPCLSDSARRSSLQLLTFQRPDEEG